VRVCENLARGFKSTKPKLFLSASGVGFYGDRAATELDESAPAGNGFMAELCREWEAAAEAFPAERRVIARFGVVLSAEGGFLRQVTPLFERFGAGRLGSGRQWFSWISQDDAASALVFALANPALSGPVNFVAPNPVTNSELTRELRRALKAWPAPPAPALALRLAYGELGAALLTSQRCLPGRLSAAGFKWRHEYLADALEDIYAGHEPGDFIFEAHTWVAPPPTEVWRFFANPRNLERMTPPILNFQVTNVSAENVQSGTTIDYRFKLAGLPLSGCARIQEWKPVKSFVDEQVRGPYRLWRHTHELQELGGGTLIKDRVRFKLPMGWLGRAAALSTVLAEVEKVFSYRNKVIGEIFSTPTFAR
jgi:ligand-binding SRPBCC domain-containing protein